VPFLSLTLQRLVGSEKCVTAKDDKSKRFLLHLKPLQGALETLCRRSLYESGALEDVLQEAVMKAFRDFGLFAEGTNFRAWIFRYAHFCILEANRRSRTRSPEALIVERAVEDQWQPAPDDSLLAVILESPEVVLEQCDESLQGAILMLREVDRAVLLLKSVGEFKYREIAEILGVPMGTVMSSLSRARQQVRHSLLTASGATDAAPPELDKKRDHRP
jgi:RNA polymerase sigma-70 factor (ECF subfamily)